uniref:TATA box-binding protein-associated factor RNA polymerase I subunit B n=1 Tax=Clastoptera arizonana TaxID=38151 RepID=A0A1B6DEA7_9HEMI
MTNPKCNICGGEDFFTDSGFFYCAECQTQSQDVREEVFEDYFLSQKGAVRTLKKQSHQLSSFSGSEGLTSWEIFNYIFKGLVDEVINLGASYQVKIVSIQLWTTYLYNLEVAFTSSKINRKPKLGLNFKPKDAEIVYGVKRKRIIKNSLIKPNAKKKTTLSSGSDSDCTTTSILSKRASARKAASAKKALVAAEYEKTLSTSEGESYSQDTSYQTLESLVTPSERSDSVKSQRIKLTKQAKAFLLEARENLKKIKKEKNKIEYRRKTLRKQSTNIDNLTLAKIVALLRLALIFCKANIYIGDILRWISEGHLSVNKCIHFIPKDVKIPEETYRVLDPNSITHSGQQITLMNLCAALDIVDFPIPDMPSLAKRYCVELQLPDDFANIIQSWISHTPKQLINIETKFESRTMAYIVILMKMIFSLDGISEYKLSELAESINRCNSLKKDDQHLFVWKNWAQYIECRKAVVSRFHQVTRQSVYKDLPGHNSDLFLEHYEKNIFTDYSEHMKLGSKEEWTNAVKRTLSKLDADKKIINEAIQFPHSLTPLFTYSKFLITEHPTKLSDQSRKILANDFTKTTVNFTHYLNNTIALNDNSIIDIQPQAGMANTFNLENFTDPKEIIEYITVNRKSVRVQLFTESFQNLEKESLKADDEELNLNEFLDIISDDSSDEEHEGDDDIDGTLLGDQEDTPLVHSLSSIKEKSSLPLYETRHCYWFCHKKIESNEDFNIFAANVFPSSFLWLLKECSRVVGVTIKDLYDEVMFLIIICLLRHQIAIKII